MQNWRRSGFRNKSPLPPILHRCQRCFRVTLLTVALADKKLADNTAAGIDEVPASETAVALLDGHSMAAWQGLTYPHEAMVKEWEETLGDVPDYRGFALAQNVGSVEEVDAIFARLREKGATIVKELRRVYWGGYSGYFADPEGNKWEVAHNPFWTIQADGRISMKSDS